MIRLLRQRGFRLKAVLALALLLAQFGASAHQLEHANESLGLGDRCYSCVLAKHFDHLATPPLTVLPAQGPPDTAAVLPCHPPISARAALRPWQRGPPSSTPLIR